MRLAAFPLACALVACAAPVDSTNLARHRPGPGSHPDAPVTVADAPSGGTGGTGSGTIACYTEGDPSATCTLPTHCCFNNYSAQHDGSCTTSACSYGTITCDGPEDCATGQLCCAHAIRDPDFGTIGYTVACQTGSCGNDSLNVEVCHPASGCSNGGNCVTAYGHDNDLPRALDVCE